MSLASATAARPTRLSGWLGAATSTDHKRIGLHLGTCSLVFFLTGGVFALLMRTQLAQPDMRFVSDDAYNELFTMHGSTMIYLFVTPMAVAMATYLVPLQIGALRLSAPRLSVAGFWTWLCGGLIMESGWFTWDGAGRTGWSSFAPLSNSTNTPGVGMDLWVVGVILVAIGLTAMAVSVAATVARRRAPGMALLRMPVFTWTGLVSVLMVVGSFPVLIVAMALLYVDRHGGHIYTGYSGAIDYQDLFWFFGHPVVYVMFFPFLGAAAEAIATCSRKKWFGYTAFVASIRQDHGTTVDRHTVANVMEVMTAMRGHPWVLALGGHMHVAEKQVFQLEGVSTRFEQAAAIVGPNKPDSLVAPSGIMEA